MEGAGEVEAANVLPQGHHQSLDDVLHVLLDDEAHLDVDLRELGLAVEPEIFVAEAAHDLEVAVHARHHEQLLEDLRRLGERVELTGVEPRGDEEVAGAAGRVLHHERGFDLGEPVGGQVAARRLVDGRPNEEVLLQGGAAQVEVAVLEPHGLARGGVVRDLEGRRFRAREDGEGVGLHFDLAGGQVRVLVAAALDDGAGDADAELSAQLAGERCASAATPGLEDHLGEAASIAKIDEHAAAVVAPGMHPAEEDDALAGVAGAERAAVVGSLQICQELGHRAAMVAGVRLVRESDRQFSPCRSGEPSPSLAKMRLRVLYHGNCFDGCSSAGVFTRFYRERIAKGPLDVVYRALEHKGDPQPFAADCFDGDENACVDFRYSQDPRLTWWFDHHASAFQLAGDEDHFRADATGPEVLRPEGEELHEVPGRHGVGQVRVRCRARSPTW